MRALGPHSLLLLLLTLLPLRVTAAFLDHAELETLLELGRDATVGTTHQGALQFEPTVEASLGDIVQGRLSARIEYDPRDRIRPGEGDFRSYSRASRPQALGEHWTLSLRDAFLEFRGERALLRLGKQQIVWGALDGIKVLDVLNPQSFEHFILEPFEDSRIGLWSAYLDLSLSAARLELAVIPDTTVHDIPEPDAWFALTAPRYRFGFTGDEGEAGIVPELRSPHGARNGYGARLSGYARGVDWQLVAVRSLEFEPLGQLELNAAQPALAQFYERRNLYGLGLERSFGSVVLRGELSHAPAQPFVTNDGGEVDTVRRRHWRGALGLDWLLPGGLFVNLQYLHDHVESAPSDLVRPATDEFVTLFVRRPFAYEAFELEGRWYRALQDDDDLLRLRLSYRWNDRLRYALIVDRFEGSSRGPFGQFDARDQVVLQIEHRL